MKKRLVIFFLAAAMVLGGCENKNSKLYKKGIEALEQKDYVCLLYTSPSPRDS
mgnify:FL=1